MCGIFGYIGRSSNAPEIVFNGIKDLEYRGYDSWGYAFANKDFLTISKKTGKIGNAKTPKTKSNIAIAHTRWATHGGVTDANAHPHPDCNSKLALIHNGIFENFSPYKETLIKQGHEFLSETDTEVMSHLLEEYSDDLGFEQGFFKLFSQVNGMNAVVAVNHEADKIIAAKVGSPLVVGFGKNENFLASDSLALAEHTNKVYFLEDNEAAVITNQEIKIVNTKNGKIIKPKIVNIAKDEGVEGMAGFSNFMLKEINEQPKMLADIANMPTTKVDFGVNKNYLVGCGSAFFAATVGKYFFAKAGVNTEAVSASEFVYQTNLVDQNTNILAISQSGETMDLLEVVKICKNKKTKINALINVPQTSLFRLSDKNILIGAGREKAVASTKALTGMIAHLLKLSKLKHSKSNLLKAADSARKLILSDSPKQAAKKLLKSKDIYIIGRGINYPAALEIALKIKEISYVHAEAFAGGELKHGALALIENGIPVVLLIPNDETKPDMLNAAHEIKARGGYLIGISDQNNKVFDEFIKIEDCQEATVIPNIIAGQLVAYYLTMLKKLDPDKPRNLAKSVTVK